MIQTDGRAGQKYSLATLDIGCKSSMSSKAIRIQLKKEIIVCVCCGPGCHLENPQMTMGHKGFGGRNLFKYLLLLVVCCSSHWRETQEIDKVNQSWHLILTKDGREISGMKQLHYTLPLLLRRSQVRSSTQRGDFFPLRAIHI